MDQEPFDLRKAISNAAPATKDQLRKSIEIYDAKYSKQITRRDFLKVAGIVAGGSAIGYAADKLLFPQNSASPEKPQPTATPTVEPTKTPTTTPTEKPAPKEVFPRPNPFLGIRNDIPEMMVWAKRLGASKIRIDGDTKKINECLSEAKKFGLDVLYVFHPTKPMEANDLDKKLKSIFDSGANITLEIGNEPDDIAIPRWDKHDLNSFSQFVALVLDRLSHLQELGVIPKNAKAVIGAVTDQKMIYQLVSGLKQNGIHNIKELAFAVHAYDSPDDIKNRVDLVKQATGGAEIIVTELGTNNVSPDNQPIMESIDTITNMYKEARKSSNQPIYIHQLPYTERDEITQGGYGYVSNADQQPLASFDKLRDSLAIAERDKTWEEKNVL